MNTIWKLFKTAFSGWNLNKVPRLSAALSYYTIFSLAPLIVIATAIASWFLGAEAVSGQLESTLRSTIGQNGAKAVQGMIESAQQHGNGTVASILGIVMLLVGATGVFIELQGALNTIWEVEPKPNRGVWGTVRDRVFSLGLVMATAFLLLVSMLVSTVLTAMGNFFTSALPGGEVLWSVVNGVVSFVIISLLFGLLFKYVPDIRIRWRDVLPGAFLTGALFTLGKALLGLYLGGASVASAYGAAGSLAIVLLWVYYVSQIVFFGAEFTKAYAQLVGAGVEVDDNAVPIHADTREAEEAVGESPGVPRPEARGRASARPTRSPAPPNEREPRRPEEWPR